jgi:putative ABC transport system permease protein
LATLLLARNAARAREMATRAALGAGRARLLRHLIGETLLLSLAGGLLGLALSYVGSAALIRASGSTLLPYTSASNALGQFWTVAPNWRVLLFTLTVSLLTALLFGLAPAFAGARQPLAETLRQGGRTAGAGTIRRRFRRALMACEVALSLMLLFGAGILAQTMARLQRQDSGSRPDHLLLAHIYLPAVRYPESGAITRFCDSFRDRVRSLPGIVDASITTGYPPSMRWEQIFTIPGSPLARAADVPTAYFTATDYRYLATLGISLLRGRDFTEGDTAESPPVAIVNEAFERRYFPNQTAVGREIHPGPPPGVVTTPIGAFGSATRSIIIVGVVRDVLNRGMALPAGPQIFALFRHVPGLNFGFKDIVVRTASDPESAAPAIARELRALDRDTPLGEVRSMRAHLGIHTADTRFTAILLAIFASVGTLLAAVGVYSVMVYLVARSTQELGVRIALGAGSSDILWLVMRDSAGVGGTGILLGLAGAASARRLLESLVYGVSPSDAATLSATAALLLVVVMIASAVPARRAIRIDPLQAIRGE